MKEGKRKELIKKYRNLKQKNDKEKKKLLDELENNNLLYVEDNVVKDSNLCIILSCPGEEELINDKVCAGETGENLEKILDYLVKNGKTKGVKIKKGKSDKSTPKRYSYTIINSVNDVHFRSYNGAEAKKKEIEDDTNVKRIVEELKTIDKIEYFIVCGNNAEILYEKIKADFNNAKVAIVSHLGWVGLRNEFKNSHNEMKNLKTSEKRDQRRLELVAEQIIKNIIES